MARRNSRKVPGTVHEGMMMRSGKRSEYNDNLMRVNQREENRLLLELEQWERAQRLTSKGRDKESQWFRQKQTSQTSQTGSRKISLQNLGSPSISGPMLIPDYRFGTAYSNLADANGQQDGEADGAARKEGQGQEGGERPEREGGAGQRHARRASRHPDQQREEERRLPQRGGSGGQRKTSQSHSSQQHSGGQRRSSGLSPPDSADDKSRSDALKGKDGAEATAVGSGKRRDIRGVAAGKDKADGAVTRRKTPDTEGLNSSPPTVTNTTTTAGASSDKTAAEKKSARPSSTSSSRKDDGRKRPASRTSAATTTTTTGANKTAAAKTPDTTTPATVAATAASPSGSIPTGLGLPVTGMQGLGLGQPDDPGLSWDGRRRYANVWDSLSTPKNFSQVRSVRERLQQEFTPPSANSSTGRRGTVVRPGAAGLNAGAKRASNTAGGRRPTKTT